MVRYVLIKVPCVQKKKNNNSIFILVEIKKYVEGYYWSMRDLWRIRLDKFIILNKNF